MAHGKQPGTVPSVLSPSSPRCPGAGLSGSGQEQQQQQGSVKKATQRTARFLTDDSDDRLTPTAPTVHSYTDPSPEDMEDACSEYDNVSSDVEQDYDEVLHLHARYYKQHFPDETKHTGGEDIPESSGVAAQQIPPRARHGTKTHEGSQSDVKPHKAGHRFMSHCVVMAGEEAEEGLKKVRGDRLLLRDGDESEEVLDGAEEGPDQTESNAQRPASLCQTNVNEKVRKGCEERRREDDTRVARNHSAPGAARKSDPSHGGQKERERQGKGRGRRAAGGETEHTLPGFKGCGTNGTEQRPKTLSKDSRKSTVRSKERPGSTKHHHHHPPPPPCHPLPQSPADPHRALPQRESPPMSGPSTANGQEIQPAVMKPPLDPHQMAEEQKESPEETQEGPEKPEQVTEQSSFVLLFQI